MPALAQSVRRSLLHPIAQVCLTALCVVLPHEALADPVDQLRQFLTQFHSARGSFEQHSPNRSGAARDGQANARSTSSGSFTFLRPGKFRWQYLKPYQQLIVSDGRTLYLYDKDLAQVTERELSASLPASPASILFGSNRFEDDFTVSNDGESGGIAWVLAVPRQKDSVFDRIRIGFRDGLPAAMQLRDTFGQSTELSFSQVRGNVDLPAADFHFVPPPGVDVLKDK